MSRPPRASSAPEHNRRRRAKSALPGKGRMQRIFSKERGPFAVKSLTCLCLLCAASSLSAANLVVSTTADSGPGSLRAAIVQANSTSESDTISFAIPSSDSGYQSASQHWRIDVSSAALPAISEALVIDGYSQPGAVPNSNTPDQGGSNAQLKIELRNTTGMAIIGIDGLSNTFMLPLVVRGLAIHSFFAQIQLGGGAEQRVEGCFLGTTIDGNADANPANLGQTGVRVQGSGPYRIGGTTPDARNVLSADAYGVAFFAVSNGTRIEGNLIGTNAAGAAAISPRAIGISLNASTQVRIGGADSSARNVISGNGFWALQASDASATTRFQGNFVGTDWSGARAIPNGLNPFSPSQLLENIRLDGAQCALQLGGVLPGESNVIAYSPVAGVRIDSCTNAAHRNRFIGNGAIALDNVSGGGALGPTPNDPGDPDLGGNGLQNYPRLTLPPGFLPGGGNAVTLTYDVDSLPANSTYPLTIEFYRGACGGGSSGVLLGSDSYEVADAGLPKSLTLATADGSSLLPLLAVAVDATGRVSEFSPMLGDLISDHGFEDASSPLPPGRCR